MARKRVAAEENKEQEFSEGLPLTEEFREAWRKNTERREMGRRLEKMRRDANLTQVELAGLMGKDQAFVARMESGRGDMPKAENVSIFAANCGLATAYAFMEADQGQLTLHELQPIRQRDEIHDAMEDIRDVRIPSRVLMAEEK